MFSKFSNAKENKNYCERNFGKGLAKVNFRKKNPLFFSQINQNHAEVPRQEQKKIKNKSWHSQKRFHVGPKFSLLLAFCGRLESAKIFNPSAWLLLCDQSDFILPKTSVPPFTTAPPNRCSLFSLPCLTLTIDWVGDELARRPQSELADEFIDAPEKFLLKNASDRKLKSKQDMSACKRGSVCELRHFFILKTIYLKVRRSEQ